MYLNSPQRTLFYHVHERHKIKVTVGRRSDSCRCKARQGKVKTAIAAMKVSRLSNKMAESNTFDPSMPDLEKLAPVLKPALTDSDLSEVDLSEVETLNDSTKETRTTTLSGFESPALIGVVSGVVIVGSMSNGIITIAIPTMAEDLALRDSLLLW